MLVATGRYRNEATMSAHAISRLTPTDALAVPFAPSAAEASIELYWLPLGAGGWFVRLNGRIWEPSTRSWNGGGPWICTTRRWGCVPEGRFVVENCWPISDGDGSARGVLVEGPVGSRR